MTNTARALLLIAAGSAAVVALTAYILLSSQDRGFISAPCGELRQPGLGPLRVVLEPEAAEWLPPIMVCAAKWNSAASRELFAPPDVFGAFGWPPSDADVLIEWTNGDALPDDGIGEARLDFGSDCRIKLVTLQMPGLAPKGLWEKIACHELGHALGLDHDDQETSYMFPRTKLYSQTIVSAADSARLK